MTGSVYHRCRRDSSEREIVVAFLEAGCSVSALNGRGIPDLVVGLDRKTHLVECKTGNGKLTDDQVEWQAAWVGEPVAIVRNAEQARALVKHWRVAQAVEYTRQARLRHYDEQGDD